ncbi:MAG: amino acid permease [Lachnospiraceae bacterium]|nr:amino acid permease [Lachnospiraceae bacterium]
MKEQTSSEQNTGGLKPYLSPLAVWALSLGSAIGWGSLIVTSSSYLSQSGPMGSILGLLIGFAMMMIMSSHYHFLANRYPGTGGLYNYIKYIFGYDHAFFVGWFMFLTYISIFWANATSIPLFARYFLRSVFSVGYLYTIFGYKVYLGEIIVTLFVVVFVGLLCMNSKKATANTMVAFVFLFTIGITVCFVAAMAGHGSAGMTMAPAFMPDKNALRQVIHIAFLSPWAFIGFETVTQSAAEYQFEHNRLFKIMTIAVTVTTALYIFVILLSVSAYPEGCNSWIDYITRLDEFEGIAGLPAFYAAHYYLGDTGVYILMASLLALVFSSLIGMMRAVSRLCYSAAQDGILPERFAALNRKQIPAHAIRLVVLISLPILFLGRTAIGWNVDTTTFGATILYGSAALAVYKVSKQEGSKKDIILSGICIPILIAFLAFLLLPNLFSDNLIASETYALMIGWSIIGVLYFNSIIRKDPMRKFGKAIVVWVLFMAFIVVLSLTWTERMNETRESVVIENISNYIDGTADSETLSMDRKEFLTTQQQSLRKADRISVMAIAGLFALSLGVMIANYYSVRKWEEQAAEERDQARTVAFTDPLTGVKSKAAFSMKRKDYDAQISDGSVKDFAVVVCDVNGLKKINDTLGHKAGDEYICQACKMICDIFQHSPVYRIGGDEFVAVLSGRDYVIRKELVLALHDRSVEHISKGGVVVSGGLSDYIPGEDSTFHSVFERADSLMYEEKQLLKSLGAVTRDDAEETNGSPITMVNDEKSLNEKRFTLIVEDEDINLIMLRSMLEDDFELLYAQDGAEALEQIRKNEDEIAIVLLDLQMPRMNGIEVLKVMKEESDLADIPVIVMTADQSAEVECLKLGAMDFIPKPYPSPEIIKARVTRCIELSEKRGIIQSTERDPISGLYNLSYFQNYVRMYDRHYVEMAMDAIVVDVNHFHMLNERYGKQYGDGVLAQIGRQIRDISREVGGVSCRQSGDTFYIYCPHREDYETMLARASEGSGGKEASSDRVRLRMGVYANVDKEIEIERRFDYAKLAANTVRSGYLKAVGIYDNEMHKAELYREHLLEDFRTSLSDNRFTVYFQPKYDIRPDKPVLSSAEALVRWNHPELGMISPGVFIPLLEDNGMILELDMFVWRETAARIRDWKNRFGYSVPVSVNVSRIDMLTPNLKMIFSDILAAYGLDTEDLMLEITESAYTEDSEQIISTAQELRGMGLGFRIEMDDFGTGYSSLGMLTHLPIDVLKLDMSFVRSAFGETRDVRMIELIIDIADYLHVPVVAEGVETEEQYLVLKAMGCDYVQGYYFSKPVPPEDFDRFLIERGEKSVEIAPAVRRTCMSITNALTSDFESIFYVDVVTAHFLEFFSGKHGELEIRPGGTDFFGDAAEELIDGVCEEDRESLRDVLSRTSLIRWISQEDTGEVSFRRMSDGKLKKYTLQTLKTRSSDDHHIVIGIRPE